MRKPVRLHTHVFYTEAISLRTWVRIVLWKPSFYSNLTSLHLLHCLLVCVPLQDRKRRHAGWRRRGEAEGRVCHRQAQLLALQIEPWRLGCGFHPLGGSSLLWILEGEPGELPRQNSTRSMLHMLMSCCGLHTRHMPYRLPTKASSVFQRVSAKAVLLCMHTAAATTASVFCDTRNSVAS